ncbi:MAG: hypothetical protein K2Q11_01045 [Burkholderiaceae bacterium]|nr:hypothetical protein [Burkholderiaceae bacterium]
MPNLFALQGPRRCGKSKSLNILFQELQNKYPLATIQKLHPGRTEINVIMSGVNGLVVGIESRGDPGPWLGQSLTVFKAANCDIIFCACRPSGMTVNSVNALHPPYIVRFVPQTQVANNHLATNTATALSLIQLAGI